MNKDYVKDKLIENKKKKIYEIDELYNLVSKAELKMVSEIKNEYYSDFYNLIKELEGLNIIKSVGKNKTVMRPILFKKYKVIRVEEEFTSKERIKMAQLNKLDLGYYSKKVLEFRKDYEIIVTINDLLRNEGKYKELTINEISYILFGYEKEFVRDKDKGIEGKAYAVMKKLKLNENNLGCRMEKDPLLNTIFKSFYEKKRRNILIIENKETYWSLNKLLREVSNNIDMLIWGQGCSIEHNFKGIVLYGVIKEDNIFYFGDIDLSGVDIFIRLKKKFLEFNIVPSISLYETLLKIGTIRGIQKSKSQNQNYIDEERLNIFLDGFKGENKDLLKNIIESRLYIPQEALNYNKLIEEYCNEWRLF